MRIIIYLVESFNRFTKTCGPMRYCARTATCVHMRRSTLQKQQPKTIAQVYQVVTFIAHKQYIILCILCDDNVRLHVFGGRILLGKEN